jgi:hypothetical protein
VKPKIINIDPHKYGFTGLEVHVTSDRIPAGTLVFKFTHEGLIVDQVTDATVMPVECRMYDEIAFEEFDNDYMETR